MRYSRELIAACVIWAAAVCTLIFGIIDSIHEHRNSPSLGVAIFLAVMACVPSAIAVAQFYVAKEDATVAHIVEVIDALHEGRRDVARLR